LNIDIKISQFTIWRPYCSDNCSR